MKTRTAMFIVTLGLSALPVSAGRLAVTTTALPGRTALPLNLGAMEGGPRGIVGYQPGDLLSRAVPKVSPAPLTSLLATPAAGSTVAASFSGAGVQIGLPGGPMTVSSGSLMLQGAAGLASTGNHRNWNVSAGNPRLGASGLIPLDSGQGQVTTVVPLPPAIWTGLGLLATSIMLSGGRSVGSLARRRQP